MDIYAGSEMMFGYFMISEKEKNLYQICHIFSKKKKMSHGMAVEKPRKGFRMPWKGLEKSMERLKLLKQSNKNIAWKGFHMVPPTKISFFGGWVWNHGTKQNDCNDSDLQCSYMFLLMVDSSQDPV